MWATWANLGPRQGQTCAQIGPTSANNNNKKPGRQRQPQQQQQNNARSGWRVCFCRRPAVRRKPHKSGRRPRGRGPWHCRRPSVVTEGYIRSPPLPPTHLLLTSYLPLPDSGSPPVYDYRCNLQCILCAAFKKNRFYRVSWPSPSPDFILATLKNNGFFMVLGLRTGSGTENWTSWRPWCQHGANMVPRLGLHGPT